MTPRRGPRQRAFNRRVWPKLGVSTPSQRLALSAAAHAELVERAHCVVRDLASVGRRRMQITKPTVVGLADGFLKAAIRLHAAETVLTNRRAVGAARLITPRRRPWSTTLRAAPDDLIRPWAVLALLAMVTLARFAVNAVLDPLPLSGDEAQYWLYGEHPAGGYYSKPPLLPWLMRAATELLGDAHWVMRLPSLVLHPAIACVLFLLGRELFDRTTGVVAALIYLTLPAVTVSSMIASTDPPMMLGWALASLALVLALRRDSLVPWALMGGAIGIGLLGKYTILAWVASAALIVTLDPHWRARARGWGWLAAGAAFLIVAAPNLLWNAQAGFPTFTHLRANADLGAGEAVHLAERAAELGDFLASQVAVFGPIAFGVLVWLTIRPATWRDPAMRYVLGLGLPLVVAIAVQAWLNRANANWAAPAYLSFSVAVAAWLVAQGRRRLMLVLTALNLAAFVVVIAAATVHRDEPSAWSRGLDPFRKLRGVDQVTAAVGPVLAGHPDAWLVMTDRMLLANVLEGTGWPLARSVLWNPDGDIDNHFDMVTSMPDEPGASFIVVTFGRSPAAVLARFAAHEPLVDRTIATHADHRTPLAVVRATGFRGYDDASGGE